MNYQAVSLDKNFTGSIPLYKREKMMKRNNRIMYYCKADFSSLSSIVPKGYLSQFTLIVNLSPFSNITDTNTNVEVLIVSPANLNKNH